MNHRKSEFQFGGVSRVFLGLLTIMTLANCASGRLCSPTSSSKPDKTVGKYAAVNGLNLYYEIHGEAKKGQVPLVLLHGGGSTLDTSFAKLIPLLARERQVIAFDQQGHGRTNDIAERPFSFTQSAADTVELLKQLGIEKADFMGYSNGGHIAIEIALGRAQVVNRLIIESANFDRAGTDPGFWKGFAGAKLEMMPAELREEYLRVAPDPKNLQSFFDKSVARMKGFKGWSEKQMRTIAVPTLVLMGDRDVPTAEHGVKMYRLLPKGQLAILPATDHDNITDRRANWIAPIVLDFLKD